MSGTNRLLASVIALALSGCAQLQASATVSGDTPSAPAAKPVDAAAINAMYAVAHREDGTVLQGAHAGAEWTKWAKPDGSMELLAGHGLFADTGKFVIRGNTICSKWGYIDHGKESCVHLVQVSADEYVTYGDDGAQGSRFKVRPQ